MRHHLLRSLSGSGRCVVAVMLGLSLACPLAAQDVLLDLDFDKLPSVEDPRLQFRGTYLEKEQMKVAGGVLTVSGIAGYCDQNGDGRCDIQRNPFGGCAEYGTSALRFDGARPIFVSMRVRAIRVFGPGPGPVGLILRAPGMAAGDFRIDLLDRNLGPGHPRAQKDTTPAAIVPSNAIPTNSFETFGIELYPGGRKRVFRNGNLIHDKVEQVLGGSLLRFGDPFCGGRDDNYSAGDCQWDFLRIWQPAGLRGDVDRISYRSGGAQQLSLVAGARHSGRQYVLAGSATGTSPGVRLGGVLLPLNLDPYTEFTLGFANSSVFVAFQGTLDASGRATATFRLPPQTMQLPPLVLHHAYLVVDAAGIRDASNPVAVTLQ